MWIYQLVYWLLYIYIIHDTQSAQISQKQDGRNIYIIIKTMCSLGYHHNGFMATHALGHIYIFIYIYRERERDRYRYRYRYRYQKISSNRSTVLQLYVSNYDTMMTSWFHNDAIILKFLFVLSLYMTSFLWH